MPVDAPFRLSTVDPDTRPSTTWDALGFPVVTLGRHSSWAEWSDSVVGGLDPLPRYDAERLQAAVATGEARVAQLVAGIVYRDGRKGFLDGWLDDHREDPRYLEGDTRIARVERAIVTKWRHVAATVGMTVGLASQLDVFARIDLANAWHEALRAAWSDVREIPDVADLWPVEPLVGQSAIVQLLELARLRAAAGGATNRLTLRYRPDLRGVAEQYAVHEARRVLRINAWADEVGR